MANAFCGVPMLTDDDIANFAAGNEGCEGMTRDIHAQSRNVEEHKRLLSVIGTFLQVC